MEGLWNLDPIYKGFDDPAYAADMAQMKQLVSDFTAFTAELETMEPVAALRRGIQLQEQIADLGTLFGYANLRSATNAKDPEPGEIFFGTVTRIMTFGAFVEIAPGKEGLVHISQLDKKRVAKVEDVVSIGDTIKVIVSEIDEKGRLNLSRKDALDVVEDI